MTDNTNLERRLRTLESPQRLDRRFGRGDFTVLASLTVVIPIVLIAIGWGVGA